LEAEEKPGLSGSELLDEICSVSVQYSLALSGIDLSVGVWF
jgi:hypothetical protein